MAGAAQGNCDNPASLEIHPATMPPIPVPTKTPLGQEELRRRTGGLGQRHRTLLFLIDGRRPLSEVLSLALQAGAATSHFEDLVRLGFVEMPAEEPLAPPVEVAHAPAQVQITHLEVEVPVPTETVERAERAEPMLAEDMTPFAPTQVQDDPEPEGAMLTEPAVLDVAVPAPLPPTPPPPPPAPLRAQTYAQAPPPVPPAAPPARHAEELPVLERARDGLLEALRHDAQPSGSRQVAERLRSVTTAAEMIEVVWAMERGLGHSQRSHRGLLALQRARELLGLGNTLVDEDSRPNRLDEWQ